MPNDTKFKSPLISPSADPDNFDMEAMERRLKYLDLIEREENAANKAEAKKALIASRQAGIDAIRLKAAQDAATQRNCSHLKENGFTHLAGQRNHSGVIILVCQACQKMFRSDAPEGHTEFLPPSLVPRREGAIGGPNAG